MFLYNITYNDKEQKFEFKQTQIDNNSPIAKYHPYPKITRVFMQYLKSIDYSFNYMNKFNYNTISLTCGDDIIQLNENFYVLLLLLKCNILNKNERQRFDDCPVINNFINKNNASSFLSDTELDDKTKTIINDFLHELNVNITTLRNRANSIVIDTSTFYDGCFTFTQGYNTYQFNLKEKTVKLNQTPIDWDQYNFDPLSEKLFDLLKQHYYQTYGENK